MIALPAVQNLVTSWWFDYEQANFEEWPRYFTEDALTDSRVLADIEEPVDAPDAARQR